MINAAAQPSVLKGAQASLCGDPCAPVGCAPSWRIAVGDRDRSDDRADAPRRDRDVERGGGVGHRLDQPLDSPDRRKRHREAIKDSRRPIADRNEPPGRTPRREHAAAKRIDGDQHARRLERSVDDPLHARIGEIEGIERAGQHAEASERQHGEDHKCPGGGERTAQSTWRLLAQIPIDKSTRNPAKRERRPAQARSRSRPCRSWRATAVRQWRRSSYR